MRPRSNAARRAIVRAPSTAASSARSTSSSPLSGTLPTTSPENGDRTSSCSRPATHSPAMNAPSSRRPRRRAEHVGVRDRAGSGDPPSTREHVGGRAARHVADRALAEPADVRRQHDVGERPRAPRDVRLVGEHVERRGAQRAPRERAATSAASSTSPPRDVFTSTAPGRIRASSGGAEDAAGRVASAARWSETTSARRAGRRAATLPSAHRGIGDQQLTPNPASRRATARPMRAVADEADGRAVEVPRREAAAAPPLAARGPTRRARRRGGSRRGSARARGRPWSRG